MNPVAPKPNARRSRRQDGMALVLVLLVIAVLALLGVAGTRSAQTELQMGSKEMVGRQALGAAEAGINHAYSLIKASVTGRPGMSAACTQCGFDSELSGGGTSGTLASIGSTATLGTQTYRFRAFGGGATDGYYVQAADTYDEVSGANNPAIDRDAKIYLVSRGRVGGAERVVTALVTATPLFGSYGVASKTNVNMSGGSSTDSFDSRDAAYAALTAGSHGHACRRNVLLQPHHHRWREHPVGLESRQHIRHCRKRPLGRQRRQYEFEREQLEALLESQRAEQQQRHQALRRDAVVHVHLCSGYRDYVLRRHDRLLRGRRRLQHHGYRRHAVSLRSVAGERVGSHAAAALELARGSELSLDPTV